MSHLSPPRPAGSCGYACKVWITRELERSELGGVFFTWFCHEMNPVQNGDSSNPVWLYLTIDRAVKSGDFNHPKIVELRRKLREVVQRVVRDRRRARALRREIKQAPLAMFRPQLWRLDLSSIAAGRIHTNGANPAWDEEWIADLLDGEFLVIVD